jgi:hypothetical protein
MSDDPEAVPSEAPPAEEQAPKGALSAGMLERNLENLLKQHAKDEHTADTYVEMAEVVVPEYEVESGEDRKATKERMAKLAASGALGFGTTAMGVGLRDLGFAIAKAGEQKDKNGGKINVKSIAKQAERIEARSKYKLSDLQGKQIDGVDPHLKEEYVRSIRAACARVFVMPELTRHSWRTSISWKRLARRGRRLKSSRLGRRSSSRRRPSCFSARGCVAVRPV